MSDFSVYKYLPSKFENHDRLSIPAEYHPFGMLDLQKTKHRSILTKGDFSSFEWADKNTESPVVAVIFGIQSISQDPDGNPVETYLQRTKTSRFYREDETFAESPSTVRDFKGSDYNVWSKSARVRIDDDLTDWVPHALLAMGEGSDLPSCQILAAQFIMTPFTLGASTATHFQNMEGYKKTGDMGRAVFLAGLAQFATDNPTHWIQDVIPDGVIDQLPTGTTVKEMIEMSLR